MMTDTLTHVVTLIRINCGECQCPFAIPESMYDKRRADGRDFWCPNGHKIHYGEFENARLKREKAELEDRLARQRIATQAARDQADAAERRRAAAKGQLTKVKKRVANGVCPCCNRTFADLARHMTSKHPDYAVPGVVKKQEAEQG